jgi:signal transduction histidine kinase
LLFAAAVGLLTEGRTSPSFVFFVFPIIAIGFHSSFGPTSIVSLCSVSLYVMVFALTTGLSNSYVMRAAYLAIAAYLIGFFGQQRMKVEARIRELDAKAERHAIARSLHDGYVQALAGVNLRLEACRELLTREQSAEALAQLTDLQTGVTREYDEVRSYIRSLAGTDRTLAKAASSVDLHTRFNVRAIFTARGMMVEQILQIVLEGMRNSWRHGRARDVTVDVCDDRGGVRITIDDDGIGVQQVQHPPWTIASRVAEFGGRLTVSSHDRSGTHLEVEIPAA